jgi:hypothetical protein
VHNPRSIARTQGLKAGLKNHGGRGLVDDDPCESQHPRRVLDDQIGSSSVKLSPEEGVRLMRAFVRIRRRSLREIVIRLAASLAGESEPGED